MLFIGAGVGGVPPWGGQVLAAIAGNTAAIAGIAAAIAGIAAAIAGNTAAIANVRVCGRNLAATRGVGASALVALRKETPGLGPQLPGPGHLGVQPAAVPVVGAVPGAIFPARLDLLMSLGHQQIRTLSIWYNDDFGIIAGDNISQRRTKLLKWSTGT